MLISEAMKKFLLKTALLLLILVGIDFVVGLGFQYLEKNAKGGYTQRDNFICNQLETDILVSGSSRCVRHYNPQIITDSLGLTCYNSGQMGNGIILNYGRLKMVGERKQPRIVIYDLYPDFDLLGGEDNHKYLTWLKSHYDRAGIADIFDSVGQTEQFKMLSRMYRYNSRIIELLADYFHPMSHARANGFNPLRGELDKSKIRENEAVPTTYTYDPLKLSYLEKMIDETKNHRLIFVVSPIWYGMDTSVFEPVKALCRQKGIEFIDFANDTKYVHHDEYFRNGSHMNARGADEFTKDLVKYLKREHSL